MTVHRTALAMALLLSLAGAPAQAREWFRPAHTGKQYVNADLTPARALAHPPHPSWKGQLVLWDGVVSKHKPSGSQHQLGLSTPGGTISVHFPGKVLNLECDRTGYRVAVKGELEIRSGRVSSLVGRSVILLSPPRPWSPCPQSPGERESARGLHSFLRWWVSFHNPQAPPAQLDAIATAILGESRRHGLDPLFLASLIQVESAFDVDAVSVSGAIGLGQLMPFTARGLGVDPWDPAQNVAGAARMLAGLLAEWEHAANPQACALASYNAGPNLVRRLGGQVPRISQTTNYVYFIGYVHQVMTRVARERGVLQS